MRDSVGQGIEAGRTIRTMAGIERPAVKEERLGRMPPGLHTKLLWLEMQTTQTKSCQASL